MTDFASAHHPLEGEPPSPKRGESDIQTVVVAALSPSPASPAPPGSAPAPAPVPAPIPAPIPIPTSASAATLVPDASSRLRFSPDPAAGTPAPPAPPARAGGVPFGRYHLLRRLGEGGMGVVWEAWDTELRRVVALKQIKAGELAGANAIERFLREARIAARLRHPNILSVHDVGSIDGRHYLTMEYVEGRTFDDFLQAARDLKRSGTREGREDLRRAVDILAAAAEAVGYAHEAGVVHRDLKPSNVLLDAQDRPWVMDFGLAKEAFGPGSSSPVTHKLTATGTAVGTPAYMSPEQAGGDAERVGPASDVWGLAAILYELLTGRPPFLGNDIVTILVAVRQDDPVSPRQLSLGVPMELEAVCLRGLEKAPERRYPNATAFARELRRWLHGDPVEARVPGLARRVGRRVLRHGKLAAAVATALTLGCALVGVVVAGRGKRELEIAERLARAARLRTVGRAAEARDLYRDALVLDPERVEAREGAAWADAQLAEQAERARAEQARALAAEAAAREATAKATRVNDVLARWGSLGAVLRELEALQHDSTLQPEQRLARADQLWPRFEEFQRGTPADAASQSAMLALAGWARRLAGRDEEGIACMRKAAALEPDLPYGPLLEALGCFGRFLALSPIPDIALGPGGVEFGPLAAEPEEARAFRLRMEELLEQAGRRGAGGEGMLRDLRQALAAMRGFQAGRYAEAEAGLCAAIDAAALECFRTELLFGRARMRFLLKRFDDATRDAERIAEVRPRDAETWYCLGDLQLGAAVDALARGTDPTPAFERSAAGYERAIALSPDFAKAHHNLAIVHQKLGELATAHGRDPVAFYQRAAADYAEALRLGVHRASALGNRGYLFRVIAEAREARGEDGRPDCERAIADLNEAVGLSPGLSGARLNRGLAWRILGESRASRGGDARQAYRVALADFDVTLRETPGDADAWSNRGASHYRLSELAGRSGEDQVPELRLSIADFDEACKLAPGHLGARNNRGLLRRVLGDALAARGEDPRESYRQSLADLDEAVRLQPDLAMAWSNRATTWHSLADAERARGVDPRPSLQRAIEDFAAAIRANPRDALPYNNRGNARRTFAELEAAAGRDGGNELRQALEDYRAALELNPGWWLPYSNRGQVLELLGRPAEAASDYEKALEHSPGNRAVEERLAGARAKAARPKTEPRP
ncbi:MAG: protein kinase [Planctomycetes bacterium]|nr:protein kinase [Planctomycetota bacterium]